MLTPAFEIKQNDGFITVLIHARFAKVAETEIFIYDEEFKFYSKPYFLRLNLPGKLIEDGRETAKFDVETGTFTVRIPKQTHGEHFSGLDMITKLLAPKGITNAKAPLIEVLDSAEDSPSDSKDVLDEEAEEEDLEEDFDWQIEQVPYSKPDDQILSEGHKYGFGNRRSGVFLQLQDELHGVIDLKDPDKTSPSERTVRRLQEEEEKFDGEYYLADLFEDDTIQEVLSYEPVWLAGYKRFKDGEDASKIVTFSEEDRQKMKDLPNKEYLLDPDQKSSVFLGLVDIIYAYAYDQRTTEGESNVESAWTIRKLSATLSWLESYTSLKMVVHSCLRRALTYPLHRHWKLSKKVLKDTIMIFSLGRRCLLKCLLEIHTCLNLSDPYYILNDLYITDYCVWLQGVSEKRLSSLTRSLTKIKIEKDDVGLELVELELAAELAQQEEQLQEDLTAGISAVSLGSEGETRTENSEHSSTLQENVCEKLGALLIEENVSASCGADQCYVELSTTDGSNNLNGSVPDNNVETLNPDAHSRGSDSSSKVSVTVKVSVGESKGGTFKPAAHLSASDSNSKTFETVKVACDKSGGQSCDSDDESSDETCTDSSSSCCESSSDSDSDDSVDSCSRDGSDLDNFEDSQVDRQLITVIDSSETQGNDAT